MIESIQMIRLIEAMNDQPIAFNKHYVFIGCGINGALMLSQLVYWTSRTKDADGWIYKTQTEWTQETGLTRKEQENARKKLKRLGFIAERKRGVPCKVFFKVERENLYKSLIEYSESLDCSQFAPNVHTRLHETVELDCTKGAYKIVPNMQSNTENTTENTTDINLGASAPEQPKKFSAKKFLIGNGVSEQTAQEFIDLKNKKRKTITERALKIIFGQASEAKLTNERVFQIIVFKGWESFNATWNWAEANSQIEQLENKNQLTPEQQIQTAPRPVLVRKTYKETA